MGQTFSMNKLYGTALKIKWRSGLVVLQYFLAQKLSWQNFAVVHTAYCIVQVMWWMYCSSRAKLKKWHEPSFSNAAEQMWSKSLFRNYEKFIIKFSLFRLLLKQGSIFYIENDFLSPPPFGYHIFPLTVHTFARVYKKTYFWLFVAVFVIFFPLARGWG